MSAMYFGWFSFTHNLIAPGVIEFETDITINKMEWKIVMVDITHDKK